MNFAHPPTFFPLFLLLSTQWYPGGESGTSEVVGGEVEAAQKA